MKVLIAGARGMLAQDLVPVLKEVHEVFSPDEKDFDITARDKIFDIVKEVSPDIVINCAAYTNVDRAEDTGE